MVEALFYLDPERKLTLQDQIRQHLVDGINQGAFPMGSRMPSSRKLAGQLGVSRNTVTAAYDNLIEAGVLESRERSGIYVTGQVMSGRVGFAQQKAKHDEDESTWQSRIRRTVASNPSFQISARWRQHPYPFINGYFDASLYPTALWREASRLALGSRVIEDGAEAEGSADDPLLIEEIRTKMLPRRAITAAPEEILITAGEQNALYLLTQLLCDETNTAVMEQPGSPALRQLLDQSGCETIDQPVDEHGMVIDQSLRQAQVVFVSPSHQEPTSVTMDNQRRSALLNMANACDQLIVENDFETEHNFLGNPHPALRSMDQQQRVVYVSGLPKMLSPGLRLGFIVAAPPLIKALRALRQMIIGRPSLLTQRTAALFLSLGHYDSATARMHQILGKRWDALRQALNHYLRGTEITLPTLGGSALWVQAPEYVPVERLATEAARRGILIEPDTHYYRRPEDSRNCYRLGVTGLPEEQIREGINNLGQLLTDLSEGNIENIDSVNEGPLSSEELSRVLTGATLHCNTFYCDPCTIELHADGRMVGRAGHADEDQDEGRWWIEDGLYCRQWKNWSYGEESRFRVTLNAGQIRWWHPADGHLVDTALIEPRSDQLDS